MSSRQDIFPDGKGWKRLSYTCRCGWVDWGHAIAGGAYELKRSLELEKMIPTKSYISYSDLNDRKIEFNNGHEQVPAFIIPFSESMGKLGLTTSYESLWAIKKGLTTQQRERVAFSIFVATSIGFEKMQSSFPFSLTTDSGFSGEDLVSNLIGFYRAFRLGHTKETDSSGIRRWLGELSEKESLAIWDKYVAPKGGIGAFKNHTFKPIDFPATACKGHDCSFPAELQSFQGAPYGQWFVRLNNPYPAVANELKRDALNVINRQGNIRTVKKP